MLDFGEAIRMLKAGNRVARSGWNGKEMFLFLAQPELPERDPDTVGLEVLPCIVMKTAQNTLCPGWQASQSDMLAEDWMEVPGAR